MNWAHMHLLLNHLPVVGSVFGLLLFAVAMAKNSTELKKVSLAAFVIIALVTIPVYVSGEPAAKIVEHLPGVSESVIEEHEDAALLSLAAVEILGAISLAGLVLFPHSRDIPRRLVTSLFILSIVVAALMAWTANLGGQIRHTEIRGKTTAPSASQVGTDSHKEIETKKSGDKDSF